MWAAELGPRWSNADELLARIAEGIDHWGRAVVVAELAGKVKKDVLSGLDLGEPLVIRHPRRPGRSSSPEAAPSRSKPTTDPNELRRFFGGTVRYTPKEVPSEQ